MGGNGESRVKRSTDVCTTCSSVDNSTDTSARMRPYVHTRYVKVSPPPTDCIIVNCLSWLSPIVCVRQSRFVVPVAFKNLVSHVYQPLPVHERRSGVKGNTVTTVLSGSG